MELVNTLQNLIPLAIPANMYLVPALVVLGMGLLLTLPAYLSIRH